MVSRRYVISGFDCASCAEKAEAHLNADPRILSARLDYSGQRLFLDFSTEELSLEEIVSLIKEVEEDEIRLSHAGAKKKTYAIKGIDCPNCAYEVERRLNQDGRVASARLDYAGGRLYLEYENEELGKDEVLSLIKEVEEDPVVLEEEGRSKAEKIEGKTVLLLCRIALAIAIFFLCGFFFHDHYWVRFSLYLAGLIAVSYDIAWKVLKSIFRRRNPLDEYLLIFLASSGAFVLACVQYQQEGGAAVFSSTHFLIESHYEAILVCLLWQIGELLQDFAVKKSRKSIEKAVESRVESALLSRDGRLTRVDAKSLVEGDVVVVPAHEIVPIDGEVIEGEGYCDTSSLTGESLPVCLNVGKEAYSGTTMVSGEIYVRAKKDYASSSSAKIFDLVTSSLQRKGKAERFITTFARYYTPVVFLLSLLYFGVSMLCGAKWQSALYTSLEIMVISCPCALVISVPLAYFASIGLASKNGIVIKGAGYLDLLLKVKTLFSDKTGTLTKGRFVIAKTYVAPNVNEEEFLSYLLSLEAHSSHPLGKAIVAAMPHVATKDVERFASLPGVGVSGIIDGRSFIAGDLRRAEEESEAGVYVYLYENGVSLGYVKLVDETKETTKEALFRLSRLGVQTHILSGDKPINVDAFCRELGVEGEGGLLPEDKLKALEKAKEEGHGAIAFLGDGVNDAPCLARADVGIAMAGLGAGLAVEEADVLLLQDDPSALATAIKVARLCRGTVAFNIAFALAVKAAVLILAIALGERMPMEAAVLADTGVSVLLTLNSLLLLRRKP